MKVTDELMEPSPDNVYEKKESIENNPIPTNLYKSNFSKNKKQYFKLLGTHHPLCGFYEDDVYKFGRVKLCKGCTAGYSGIYLTIGLLVTGTLPAYLYFGTLWEYFRIVLLIAPIVVLYDLQKKKKIIPRFPVRMITGVFFVLSIYTLFHINPWYMKIPLLMFIFLMGNITSLLRYKKLNKVCGSHCGDRRLDWCPYALGLEKPPELLQLLTINS